jgi:cystathionine beta-lyase/cystathionine gamma-synthase
VVVESPTNPVVDVVDLGAVAAAAHDRGLTVVVDNTFATPVLQRPLTLGADVVMHSLTKALAGHSDVVGGALIGRRELIEPARELLRCWAAAWTPIPRSSPCAG